MGGYRRILIRLAYDGVIPLGKFQRKSSTHQLLLGWLVGEAYRRERIDFYSMEHDRCLRYLATGLSKESWKEHQQLEQTTYDKLQEMKFGLDTQQKHDAKNFSSKLQKAWADAFGQVDDPETQRKIEETALVLKLRRTSTDRE